MVMRIWRLLTSTKRLGQAHGVDSKLAHRHEGNLIVHCPACPDPYLNMEPGWERTPDHLMSVISLFLPTFQRGTNLALLVTFIRPS